MPSEPVDGARLRRCDLAVCEGVCCHDGVWLTSDDEARIRTAVRERPSAFTHVPKVKIVTVRRPTGQPGEPAARKTATRPWRWRSRPAHFTDTRCVFAHEDGRCSLQVAAVDAGHPPWTWKPLACWLHPLRIGDRGRALLPPPLPADDPDAAPGYPGFISSTPCGAHREDGTPWRDLLAEEQAWWAKWVKR